MSQHYNPDLSFVPQPTPQEFMSGNVEGVPFTLRIGERVQLETARGVIEVERTETHISATPIGELRDPPTSTMGLLATTLEKIAGQLFDEAKWLTATKRYDEAVRCSGRASA